MREDYVPSEKYRNMFGIERNGYGMERVDLYLAQLEVAFKKIREDNRNLKREFSAQPMAQAAPPDGVMQQLAAQEQYIGQLQAQLTEQQAQFADHQEQGQLLLQLQAQLAEQREQNNLLLAQLNEANTPAQRQDDQLLSQMEALRAEADELRRQLRRQAAVPPVQQLQPQQPQYPAAPRFDAQDPSLDARQEIIGKVLVDARTHAEEIRRAAQLEADKTILAAKQTAEQTISTANQQANLTIADAKRHAEQTTAAAQQKADVLHAEKERTHTQLQEISYALRGVLRLSEPDYTQRGEDFAEE